MLCRITNDQPGPRVYFDRNRRPVLVDPGKTVQIDLDPSAYEDARASALVKLGPQIEALEEPEPAAALYLEPEPEPPEPEPLPIKRRRKQQRKRLIVED